MLDKLFDDSHCYIEEFIPFVCQRIIFCIVESDLVTKW